MLALLAAAPFFLVLLLGSASASPFSPAALDDSSGFRLVWPTTNTEPISGYLITQRLPGSLDYDVVTNVGLVDEWVTTALSDSVYFGLSVFDAANHRALVTEEKLAVLSSIPGPPVDLAASPDGDWWGFPLYHLNTADAQAAIVAAMTYFGELPSTGAPEVVRSGVLSLGQSQPNPFRDATTIRYSVFGERARVELTIYDLAGRRVCELVSGEVPGGLHDAVWQGRNGEGRRVASGVYFYRLKGENRSFTKKLVLLR
jgi:hypothetical protein